MELRITRGECGGCMPTGSFLDGVHSASRNTLRRFIRSRACTTSFLSSTARRCSTVRVASRGPGSIYSPRMRLASSTARISVSWSGLFMTARKSTEGELSRGRWIRSAARCPRLRQDGARRVRTLTLCVAPVQLVCRFAVITAGIGFHHARIHREPLALDEARCHGGCNHTLEDMAQYLALPEAAESIHRERRMVRNLIV
jgi:hypothetical protein